MSRLRPMICFTAFLLLLSATAQNLRAQATTTASVVMLSDVHFDPFRDPAKLPALRAEPVDHWPAIFSAAPSRTQAADLETLQAACGGRALDTAWPLLRSSLAAAQAESRHPAFVTLSGDLLAHEFPCRFQQLTPGATPQDLAAFAAKTVAFVMQQTRDAFPHVAVYGALGNNDSGCADYRETPGDAFNTASGKALAAAANANVAEVTPEGDYSVALPAPIAHGRLLVLQDIFETRQYNTCAGAADRAPEKAQVDWLRAQLDEARAHHEQVWVMAHVPPGVDIYTSFRRYVLQPSQLCSAEPRAFLTDPVLADTLLGYADIIRLALFGHTHMDDIRVLTAGGDQAMENTAAIPAKLVPSISPILGNHPAFLVATVDARTAVLKDWRTFTSPGPEGSTPPWAEAYRYSTTYHLPDLSGASALKLANSLVADPSGQAAASTAFRRFFYPGDFGMYALGLAQIWPAYACSVRNSRPSAAHSCICAAISKPQDANPAP